MFMRLLTVVMISLLMAGCASGPGYSRDGIDAGVTPRTAVEEEQPAAGTRVLWGGRIIQVEPAAQHTVVEIVAFPLRSNQRPDAGETSQGRFLVRYPGYLEPEDYQPERLLTVIGAVAETRLGKVGEAAYRYPVVVAEDLYLWPEDSEGGSEPRVHFGLGVGIMR